MLDLVVLTFHLLYPRQRLVPPTLDGAGDQTIAGIRFPIPPLGQLCFVLCSLDTHLPLAHEHLIATLQILEHLHGEFQFSRLQSVEHLLGNRRIQRIAAYAHAVLGRSPFAMVRAAYVGRIDPARAAVTHIQSTPALTAHQQALQERRPFAYRPSRNHRLCAGSVLLQAQLNALVLLPVDVAVMVPNQEHAPLRTLGRLDMTAHLPIDREFSPELMSTVGICPGVTRVLQYLQRPAVSQVPPYQLAVPHAAVASLGEKKLVCDEPLHHRVGTAGVLEQPEDQCHGATHLLIRIQNNLSSRVVANSCGQRYAQLSALCLVQLPTLEAGAQEVQFGFAPWCP